MQQDLVDLTRVTQDGTRVRARAGAASFQAARRHGRDVNADAKEHRGLDLLAVRGLDKILGSASLFAPTYNILRLIALGG